MRSIHLHKINFAWTLVLAVALPQSVRASEPAPQIAVRFIVLAESDGTNAAASTKRIQEQVAVLRNDAARHGIHVSVGPTQFVEDSAVRKLHASDATGLVAHRPASARPDEIVIYVTSLTAPNAGARYLLLPSSRDTIRSGHTSEILRSAQNDSVAARNESRAGSARRDNDKDSAATTSTLPAPDNASADEGQALPAIVIDSKEFGGQGCGTTRAAPCRVLTLALAEALSISAPQEAVRRSAAEMKLRTQQTIAVEP